MYTQLFNQTQLSSYKIAQILNIKCSDINYLKKRKTIDITQFISFMQKLNITEFKSENEMFSVSIKIKRN